MASERRRHVVALSSKSDDGGQAMEAGRHGVDLERRRHVVTLERRRHVVALERRRHVVTVSTGDVVEADLFPGLRLALTWV